MSTDIIWPASWLAISRDSILEGGPTSFTIHGELAPRPQLRLTRDCVCIGPQPEFGVGPAQGLDRFDNRVKTECFGGIKRDLKVVFLETATFEVHIPKN